MNELTQEQLKEILYYDPETGIFTWCGSNKFNNQLGRPAGSLDKNTGYIRIRTRKHGYMSHRLAWLYVYGVWPSEFIDHVNGIRHDNRICNLREASHTENNRNRGMATKNTSGYKGVSWHKLNNKWIAQISVENKSIHLGYFNNPEQAYVAYQTASLTYHGEFGNV